MISTLDLLDYIQCPSCKCPILTKNRFSILCTKCKNEFPIIDGIPILVKPLQQQKILRMWNKTEDYNKFEFTTTTKISQLVQSNTYSYSISLDVGCGVGAYQKDFSGRVISFDYIPCFVKKAIKKFGNSNRLFIIVDANDFPFKNKVFDFELCSQVVEHFYPKDSKKLLQNMIRTNKGTIIVDTPNDGNPFIHTLRNLVYPDIPNQIYGKRTDTRMLHHTLMSRKDFEQLGYSVHSCIGFVSQMRFKIPYFWNLYDRFVWAFPDLGGNLVAIYKAIE